MLALKLFLLLAFINGFLCHNNHSKCVIVSDNDRIDCHPDAFPNEQKCIDRGCCHRPSDNPSAGDVPYCYFPPGYAGYEIKAASSIRNNLVYELRRIRPSGLPDDIQLIR
ncbi:lysosomal alpha-glucosidase-like protein [Dinothrombium tinctorium]|uniref:Lysosomal alpha-glucosidase-like protein n=1 Tax=Dinothrombium tinctorium TaxID=1965070 RepID=A0A443QAK9_9ACAR|nr:lysosomal alpha-glucosidase-like protein [Dinothrombium tinctorium]